MTKLLNENKLNQTSIYKPDFLFKIKQVDLSPYCVYEK